MHQLSGQRRRAVQLQVHRDKSQLRGDIAGAQPRAKLDTVYNRHPLVEKINVVTAQIPMPFAYATLDGASLQEVLVRVKKLPAESLDAVVLFGGDRVSNKRGSLMKIVLYGLPDDLRGAIRCCFVGARSMVKMHKLFGDRMDACFGDAAF